MSQDDYADDGALRLSYSFDEIESALDQMAEKFKAVSSEDIQRVAQDIFKNKNLNLAIVGPHQHHRLKAKLYPILKF